MDKKINCFLIGAQKAGTSSFYNWLSQHPEINAPEEMKDTHFFSHEKYFLKGTDWLESFYKSNVQKPVLLKGAVNYIYFPQIAAAIKNYNNQSKFILVLRDPVKRALSAYQYFYKLGTEKRSFEQAIKEELQEKFHSAECKANFAYLDHGYYHRQIENWLKYFDRETLCIHIYEILFKDPEIALQETFDFLGVDKNFNPSLYSANQTGVVKYKWINDLIFSSPKLLKILKQLKINKIIGFSSRVKFLNWLRDWNTDKTKINNLYLSQERYQELSRYYESDIYKLSQLLNKDLKKIWKY